MNADLTLSADQVALVRRYLDAVDQSLGADEVGYRTALVRLRVIVDLVLSDAIDRATSLSVTAEEN